MFTVSNGYGSVVAGTKAGALKKLAALKAKGVAAERAAATRAAAAGFYLIHRFTLWGQDGGKRLVEAGTAEFRHYAGEAVAPGRTALRGVQGAFDRTFDYEHTGLDLIGLIVGGSERDEVIGVVVRRADLTADRPTALVLAAEPFGAAGAVYAHHDLPVVPVELFRRKDGATPALAVPNVGRAIDGVVRAAVERADATDRADALAEECLAERGRN